MPKSQRNATAGRIKTSVGLGLRMEAPQRMGCEEWSKNALIFVSRNAHFDTFAGPSDKHTDRRKFFSTMIMIVNIFFTYPYGPIYLSCGHGVVAHLPHG